MQTVSNTANQSPVLCCPTWIGIYRLRYTIQTVSSTANQSPVLCCPSSAKYSPENPQLCWGRDLLCHPLRTSGSRKRFCQSCGEGDPFPHLGRDLHSSSGKSACKRGRKRSRHEAGPYGSALCRPRFSSALCRPRFSSFFSAFGILHYARPFSCADPHSKRRKNFGRLHLCLQIAHHARIYFGRESWKISTFQKENLAPQLLRNDCPL